MSAARAVWPRAPKRVRWIYIDFVANLLSRRNFAPNPARCGQTARAAGCGARGGRRTMRAAAIALCALWRGASAHTPQRCYDHEELRAGGLWVVDCHGHAGSQIGALANGPYHYADGGHAWSSRDTRVGAVSGTLPAGHACTSARAGAWARCMQVPPFFAWCDNATRVTAVRDGNFPRDAESSNDLVDAMRLCAPRNTTVARRAPFHAQNVRDVERARVARDNAELATMYIVVVMVVCCLMCAGSGKGRRGGGYSNM